MKNLIYTTISRIAHIFFDKQRLKLFFEINYWRMIKILEISYRNLHYEFFYNSFLGLNKDFYDNKKILDIGCGPRGSLEWAKNTNERIGLDPLVEKYKKLGILKHKMEYVHGKAEKIPFPDNHFDIVSSFNSLDHVNNIEISLKEIKRVLKPGGYFLLIVNLHKYPHICEPNSIDLSILEKLKVYYSFIKVNHYKGNRFYKSLRKNNTFPDNGKHFNKGVLAALLKLN